MVKRFLVCTDESTAETEALKITKPPRLLCSYFYHRTKPLEGLIEKLGYEPEILLDCGAWSAFNSKKNKGRGIPLPDYLKYYDDNKRYISEFISLDVIGDPVITKWYYLIARDKGYDPIPVYGYGSDLDYLESYLTLGVERVALGASAMRSEKDVEEWIRDLNKRYPRVKFHVLGASSKLKSDEVKEMIYSADSSTYMMYAINGRPKEIPGRSREAKIERAVYNIRKGI